MTGFEDKVVWITGGGTGIGRSLALEFAKRGAHVAVSGRRRGPLDAVVAEVQRLGRKALAVELDVRDDDAVKAACAEVVSHFERLDVAVANAGMGVMGRFEKLTDAEWRRQIDVNLFGVVNTARHALPELRETRGRLVLVSSISGLMCAPAGSAYSASKFAVRAIGLTLSMELQGSGVSCTLVNPGFVESDINKVDNQGVFDASREERRPKALIWSGEKAARVVVDAVHARKREFTFTGHGKIGAFLGQHLPGGVHFVFTRIAKRFVDDMAPTS